MRPDIVKRIENQGLGKPMAYQSKGMPCILCGTNFTHCSHSVADTDLVLKLYRAMKLSGGL